MPPFYPRKTVNGQKVCEGCATWSKRSAGFKNLAALNNPIADRTKKNPQEWFHGSPREFEDFDDPSGWHDTDNEEATGRFKHWNTLLGNHFTSDHSVANEFSSGEHSHPDDQDDDYEGPLGHVVHVKLHMKNPKVYDSEHDMDREVYEHEWERGNTHDSHNPPPDDDADEDEREEWDEYAGERRHYAYDSHHKYKPNDPDPNYAYGFHPKATGWLNTHPDKGGIANRYKARLQRQGYDGILYGNEYEHSFHGKLATSAIAFEPHQIEITQHHYGREDCLSPEEAKRRTPPKGQLMLPGTEDYRRKLPKEQGIDTSKPWPTTWTPSFFNNKKTSAQGQSSYDTGRLWAPLPQECWDRYYGRHTGSQRRTAAMGDPTDWNEYYDPGMQVHRGMFAKVPFKLWEKLHDPEQVEQAGQELADHTARRKSVGMHWSSDLEQARDFGSPKSTMSLQLPVVLHGQVPAREAIETRPSMLKRNEVFPYDHREREVPLRKGSGVDVFGISWKPEGAHSEADEHGWVRHDFTAPVRHTASAQGPFFHGTASAFQPGDLIDPERQLGGRKGRSYVFMTLDPEAAHNYGRYKAQARQVIGEDVEPHAYEVEPTGPVEPDDTVHERFQAWRSRHPLRVVREIHRGRTATQQPHGEQSALNEMGKQDVYAVRSGDTMVNLCEYHRDVHVGNSRAADSLGAGLGIGARERSAETLGGARKGRCAACGKDTAYQLKLLTPRSMQSRYREERQPTRRGEPYMPTRTKPLMPLRQSENTLGGYFAAEGHYCSVCKTNHDHAWEAEEHEAQHTDWDEHYPTFHEIHRGVAVRLPKELHDRLHADDDDLEEEGDDRGMVMHDLIGHLNTKPGGWHWTADHSKAQDFSHQYAGFAHGDHDTPITHLVITGDKPAREDIETDPDKLAEDEHEGVSAFDENSGEKEVPLKRGTKVHVKSIDWKLSNGTHPYSGWRGYHVADDDELAGGPRHVTATWEQTQLFHAEPVHRDPEPEPEEDKPWCEECGEHHDEDEGHRECAACGERHEDYEDKDRHESTMTDWDEVYPRLGSHIHRVLEPMRLPASVHQVVHDESRPIHERGQALLDHIDSERGRGLGMHWSDVFGQDRGVGADKFAEGGTSDEHATQVVLHARKPERHDIETDPDTLDQHAVYGYDVHDENEVPLQYGAPVHITGVSWRPGGYRDQAWRRHNLKEPMEMTASKKLPTLRMLAHDATENQAIRHCFTGDTRYLTAEGVKTLAETVGTVQRVLTGARSAVHSGRWVEAMIHEFGEQPVLRVTLRRNKQTKVIRVTAEHRWLVRRPDRIVLTQYLRPGHRLAHLRAPCFEGDLDREGIRMGAVFGDGYVARQAGRTYGGITLWGAKRDLAKYFDEVTVSEPRTYVTESGVQGLRYQSGMTGYTKQLPELTESLSYLHSWLMGYFAMDGHVSTQGQVTLSSASLETLLHVRDLANLLGIGTYAPTSKLRRGYGTEPTLIHEMGFSAIDLSPSFFLRDDQRAAWRLPAQERFGWTVVSVQDHGETEMVYCPRVPETESFVLEDNIHTMNCPFCGSGKIIGRQDGSVECEFCHGYFTVQTQPQYPNYPQTVGGVPQQIPGMPGQVEQPSGIGGGFPPGQEGEEDGNPFADEGQDEGEEGFPPDEGDDQEEPPPFAKKSFRTVTGARLSEDDYVRHLAISLAPDRAAMIERIRQERGA